LTRLLYAAVPGFKLFRLHSRMLLLEQLALLLLAGRGLDVLLRERQRPESIRLFAGACGLTALVAAAAAAAWSSPAPAWSALWLGLTAAAFALQRRLRPWSVAALGLLPILDGGFSLMPAAKPVSDIFPDQAFYAPLKRDQLQGRVAAVGRKAIPYGAAGVLGIDLANGYEPLNLRHFEDYFALLKYGDPAKIPKKPVVWTDLERVAKPEMLRALDVRYLAANERLPLEPLGFELVHEAEGVPVFDFYEGMTRSPLKLYRDRRPLGPAYFATSVRPVAGEEASLAAVAAAASVTEAHVLGLDRPGSPRLPGGSAAITRRGYDEYAYKLDSRGDNFLILSQVWYPGWRAWLDGAPVALYRVNHALLGCFVPPGAHELRLAMTSPQLRRGLVLFGFGLAGLALLLFSPLRRGAPSNAPEPWLRYGAGRPGP
jgi:hypothetical protein